MAYKLEVIVQNGNWSEQGIIDVIEESMIHECAAFRHRLEPPIVKVISIKKVRDRKSLNAENQNQID